MDKWAKALEEGDSEALVELSVERGLHQKEEIKVKDCKSKKQPVEKSRNTEIEHTPVKFFKDDDGSVTKPTFKDNSFTPLKDVIGTRDTEIAEHIWIQTANGIDPKSESVDSAMNVALQSLYDQNPKDAVEARLISQITSLYAQGMSMLAAAQRTERYESMQYYGNLATKFLRLHNETIEALSKYRRGGEQRIVIQHQEVNISDQGQAVVGQFHSGGGGKTKNRGDTPCKQGNAEQNLEPMEIDHAKTMPCPTGDVECTEVKAPVRGRKRGRKK